MKKREKYDRGITLINLVITIVIMLILVSVVLNMVIGDNGTIKKAIKARDIYENARNNENEELKKSESEFDKVLLERGELIEKDNVIKVYYESQLKTLCENVKNGNTYKGKNIVLENEIDLNKDKYTINDNGTVNFASDAKEWIPIGTAEKPFEGTLDGNGFIIKGLYINNTKNYQGLVGFNKGNIKNIGIKYGSVKANNYVGALAGMNNGDIQNCFNAIPITGNLNIGGIAGESYGDKVLNVKQCFNQGAISGVTNVGGILGNNHNMNDLAIGYVTNCYNEGEIVSLSRDWLDSKAGGIVGYNSSNANGTNNVTNCYSIGKVKGSSMSDIGGVIGKNYTGDINNCYYLEKTVNYLDNDLDGSNKGEHKTLEELKTKDTYINWDFDTIWYVRENNTPGLSVFKDIVK